MGSPVFTKSDMRRFEDKYVRFDDHECWPWVGAQIPSGYGAFVFGGRQHGAHRVAWMMANGAIPGGMYVLHSCDSPSCVNPSHLRTGTQQENADDCGARGRRACGESLARIASARSRRGEESQNAKLTEAQVLEIRRLRAVGELNAAEFARTVGVHVSTVRLAAIGETWGHLEMVVEHV